MKLGLLPALTFASFGVLIGLGGTTFDYVEGLSYLSTDRAACANCHMPYARDGATKVSDQWVRSPLLNINRACQTSRLTKKIRPKFSLFLERLFGVNS